MDEPQAIHPTGDSDKSVQLIDRLSNLPNSLILKILSSLPMRDVVQTTILSKQWNGLWTTVPCLNFRHCYGEITDDECRANKFRNFVNGALALWNGAKIVAFILPFFFDDFNSGDVLDLWVQFAIERQVEHLYIRMENCICSDSYVFNDRDGYYAPQRLYLCSSVRSLRLISCKIEIVEDVQWIQLKSLTISITQHSSDAFSDYALSKILSGSPQLENLCVSLSESVESFNFRSISLKILRFSNFGITGRNTTPMLTIWAPNLETLDISHCLYGTCSLCVPSLKNAVLCFRHEYYMCEDYSSSILHEEMLRQVILSISHVEKVTLSSWCTKVLSKMKMKNVVLVFPNAKILQLEACAADLVLYVLDMFPKMTELILKRELVLEFSLSSTWIRQKSKVCAEVYYPYIRGRRHLLKARPDTPSPSLVHLRRVEIIWDLCNTPIFPVLEIILENAVMLEKMVISSKYCAVVPETLEEKARSIPRSSPTADLIIINDRSAHLPEF